MDHHLNAPKILPRQPNTDLRETIELELQIEELEERIAPDGGETVLPLPTIRYRYTNLGVLDP